jgi:hypothetical protein
MCRIVVVGPTQHFAMPIACADAAPTTSQGSRRRVVEWVFLPIQVPLPVETLFRDDVDINEPYDRTPAPDVRR